MDKELCVGDNVCVLDKWTDKLLVCGPIARITKNPAGFSIDNLLFINPKSENLHIINDKKLQLPPYHCSQEILDKYKYFKDNNLDNGFEYDFFTWTPIEPEVKETVDLLNSLGFIETYSSCSGHGKIPAYVDFEIKSLDLFFIFLDKLKDFGLTSYTTKHGELKEGYKYRFVVGVEGGNTCHLELVDVDSNFDFLNKAIKKYLLR